MKKKHIPFYPVFFLFKTAYFNKGVSLKKTPLFAIFIVRYILLEPLRLLEIFIHDKRINHHKMDKDPIFILGHWRSGTSYLQDLLSKNNAHTSYTIFRFLFADTFIITQRWLNPILNWVCNFFKVPYSFQRIQMDLNFVGELESAMCSICSPNSYTWGQIFPKNFKEWLYDFIELKDTKLSAQWIADYDYLIRKISYNSNGKRVVVKSPGDTARAILLLKKYPNAKFIYMEREPLDVFHSSRYLWSVIQKQNSFNVVSNEQIDEYIILGYKIIFSKYLEFKKVVPNSQLIEIKFDNLLTHPLRELNKIYSQLNLGRFKEDEVTGNLKVTRNQKKNYHTSKELKTKLIHEWELIFKNYSSSI